MLRTPALAAGLAAVAIAGSASAEILVDDFSDGAFTSTITDSFDIVTGPASVIGGERDTGFGVQDNPFDASLTVAVGGGQLSYESGFGLDGFLLLAYDGVGVSGLDLDVSGELSLDVEVADTDMPLVIRATLINLGDPNMMQTLTGTVNPGETLASFDLSGYDAIDLTDVDVVALEFDSFSSTPSLDFVLDRVAFVPAPGAMALLGLAGLAGRGRRRA